MAKIAKGLQELAETPKVDQEQAQSTAYQDIEYCMANTGQFVSIGQHKHIELDDAISKTRDLDWTYRKNGISSINNKTEDSLFFCRRDSQKWYADTPIRLPKYDGLVWASIVDQPTMEKLLNLFFAESDWYSATSWFESPDPFEIANPGNYGID